MITTVPAHRDAPPAAPPPTLCAAPTQLTQLIFAAHLLDFLQLTDAAHPLDSPRYLTNHGPRTYVRLWTVFELVKIFNFSALKRNALPR